MWNDQSQTLDTSRRAQEWWGQNSYCCSWHLQTLGDTVGLHWSIIRFGGRSNLYHNEGSLRSVDDQISQNFQLFVETPKQDKMLQKEKAQSLSPTHSISLDGRQERKSHSRNKNDGYQSPKLPSLTSRMGCRPPLRNIHKTHPARVLNNNWIIFLNHLGKSGQISNGCRDLVRHKKATRRLSAFASSAHKMRGFSATARTRGFVYMSNLWWPKYNALGIRKRLKVYPTSAGGI